MYDSELPCIAVLVLQLLHGIRWPCVVVLPKDYHFNNLIPFILNNWYKVAMALLITWPEAKHLWLPSSQRQIIRSHQSFYNPPALHPRYKRRNITCATSSYWINQFELGRCYHRLFDWAILPDRLNSAELTIQGSSLFNICQQCGETCLPILNYLSNYIYEGN